MTNESLIVYFSQTGKTKIAADKIKALTDADIVRLQPAQPYHIYQVMQWSDRVDVEGKTNAYPAIKGEIENWHDYRLIYLGFPIWFWGAPTRIMATLFRDYDFSGKVVAPFDTSYSTDEAEAMAKLEKMTGEQDVNFLPGFRYRGNDRALTNWLNRLEMTNHEVG